MNRKITLEVAIVLLLAGACLALPSLRTKREVVMSVTDDNYEQQLSILGDGIGFYHDGEWDTGLADRLAMYRDLVYAVNCSTDPDLCLDNKVKKADRPAILIHKNRKIVARKSVQDETSDELFEWAADTLAGKIIQANPDHDDADAEALKEGYALVEYYAYWCGHCKSFSPVLRELSLLMENSDVKIMRVECSDNKVFCANEGIEGFPTIHLTLDGELIVPYSGDRSDAHEIQEWITRSISAYEDGL